MKKSRIARIAKTDYTDSYKNKRVAKFLIGVICFQNLYNQVT